MGLDDEEHEVDDDVGSLLWSHLGTDGREVQVTDDGGEVTVRVFGPGLFTSTRAVQIADDDVLDLMLALARWLSRRRFEGR